MLILDNIEVKDISLFKEKFGEFYQKQAKQQQKQQEMAAQMNPMVIKKEIAQMEIESKQMQEQAELQNKQKDRQAELLKTAIQMQIESQKAAASNAADEAKILVAQTQAGIAAQRAAAEDNRSKLDAVIQLDKHAYNKIESDREHALEQSKHAADILKSISSITKESNKSSNPDVTIIKGEE